MLFKTIQFDPLCGAIQQQKFHVMQCISLVNFYLIDPIEFSKSFRLLGNL